MPSAILESAGVYFAAIWLNSAKDDILIPLNQPPAGLQENKPYADKQVHLSAFEDRAAGTGFRQKVVSPSTEA